MVVVARMRRRCREQGCAGTLAPLMMLHPTPSVQTSPFLIEMLPFHEPPMVKTRPSDSSVLACRKGSLEDTLWLHSRS